MNRRLRIWIVVVAGLVLVGLAGSRLWLKWYMRASGTIGPHSRRPMLKLLRFATTIPASATSTSPHPCWRRVSRHLAIFSVLTDCISQRRGTRSGPASSKCASSPNVLKACLRGFPEILYTLARSGWRSRYQAIGSKGNGVTRTLRDRGDLTWSTRAPWGDRALQLLMTAVTQWRVAALFASAEVDRFGLCGLEFHR